ncbi:patatin-like phospholipase family protein [Denitrificimonas sp. JX-1]|uniref:Patatin-like phospholipase family protein n=2 Tax=Denitrificimonas halotolerans TaxID=3098930 RepID=A0ABU5GPC6_9GAMM|nr:patatin-like phospholipase family protein [Denitrificimonas sp. JX-1]MDY7218575.1 patatin-like phospholipase family protein [Denitrificimonas sp. JX-1]
MSWAQSAAVVETERERVGLVLSGGAARGLAHIGVLKALEEQGVVIDAIAGTSMGAVVGGLYAAGYSTAELVQLATELDWQQALSDAPSRQDIPFRRKQDDRDFLVKQQLSFRDDGSLGLPLGVLQGQNLALLLEKLFARAGAVEDFDQLPIPFRAVAADIATGETVVFSRGHLALAVRASMSIPALLTPVELDGRLLVDGGISNNIPVDIARQMGVDRVVVVDIGSPLAATESLQTVFNILNQSVALLTRRNSDAQLATLHLQDILVQPELTGFGVTDFSHAQDMMDAGYRAAYALQPRLIEIAQSLPSQSRLASNRKQRKKPPTITEVRVENTSKVGDEVVRYYIRQSVGEPLDVEKLQKDMGTLYGLEYFDRVEYRLQPEADGAALIVMATDKSSGTDYLRLGLNLSDDLRGDSVFNIGASFRMNGLNRLGGEWLSRIQLGEHQELYSEFYQPLDIGSRYFVSPWLHGEVRNIKFNKNSDPIAEYRLQRFRYGFNVGRQISNNGEIRFGVGSGWGDADVRIGDPRLPDFSFKEGYYQLQYAFDSLDNVHFPTRGEELRISAWQHATELGSDERYQQWLLELSKPLSWGANTFILGGRYARTLDAKEVVTSSYQIGGAQQLSGYRENALSGQNISVGRVIYYRRVTPLRDFSLGLPVYAGMSLERGRVWNHSDHLDSGYINAMSVFMAVDTPIGPLNFSYGINDDSKSAFYLNLGRSF